MEVLPSYNELSLISNVNLHNNSWQCDCRMAPFRQKMNGSTSFGNQIICEEPRNLIGQRLQDIKAEDLICVEPRISSFMGVENKTFIQGETVHLTFEVSGIPTPDITVTLPTGLKVTVGSVGRVTVELNGTIIIRDAIIADADTTVTVPEGVNVYENDDEGEASADSVSVQDINVYENDDEENEEAASATSQSIYGNESSQSIYGNENEEAVAATSQPIYGNESEEAMSATSQPIYGNESEEAMSATSHSIYEID
ncbi:PXDN [Branchiostoma lanceolatum]|uniref:PXDN protein n=1 Tax=Branchiostoma lanceolatum TaxID=7740 RepID=A0A8K0EY39_BRALA|nr:PXDN [Branchiostoma lanceolatum]